jgi:serine/threonine protein kinase
VPTAAETVERKGAPSGAQTSAAAGRRRPDDTRIGRAGASAARGALILTQTDRLAGTPLYLCPEAWSGAAPTAAFDLWSLSLVLFEAIAGQHPFHASTIPDVVDIIRHGPALDIRAWRPDAPAALADFFERALARHPARRPQTAGELRIWLQRVNR